MIIEVIPMVERAFIDLDNLKGGKGRRMLKFAEEVQSTGQYQGVKINRHRHVTRAKTQTRLEQFTPTPLLNHRSYRCQFDDRQGN